MKELRDRVEFHNARPDQRAMNAQLTGCRKLLGDAADLAKSMSGRSTGPSATKD